MTGLRLVLPNLPGVLVTTTPPPPPIGPRWSRTTGTGGRETENHPGHNRLAREKVRDLAAYRFRNHLNLDPPLELVAALILIARARQRTTNLGNIVPARVVAMAAGTAADAGLPHDQQEIRHRLPRKPLSLKAYSRVQPVLHGRPPAGSA